MYLKTQKYKHQHKVWLPFSTSERNKGFLQGHVYIQELPMRPFCPETLWPSGRYSTELQHHGWKILSVSLKQIASERKTESIEGINSWQLGSCLHTSETVQNMTSGFPALTEKNLLSACSLHSFTIKKILKWFCKCVCMWQNHVFIGLKGQ